MVESRWIRRSHPDGPVLGSGAWRVDALIGKVALHQLDAGAGRVEEESDSHISEHVGRLGEELDTGGREPIAPGVDVADLEPEMPHAPLQIIVAPVPGRGISPHLDDAQ